jgi:hypothetical protein
MRAPGMTAEELVRAPLALAASGDVDAVNDRFALELVEQSPRGLGGWATMGPGTCRSAPSACAVAATTWERRGSSNAIPAAWDSRRRASSLRIGMEGDRLRSFDPATAAARFPT